MKSSLASRKKEKLGVILSLAVLMGAQGSNESSDPKYPWSFPDFSATQVVHGASYDLTAKVYRSGSTVRVDTSAAISVLFIPSSSKVYSLTTYPDGSHQCVVMRPDQARMMPSPLELLYGTQVKRTAKEPQDVEGHHCKVENVVVKRADGKQVEATVWEAEDLNGVPVKIESQIGARKLTASYRDFVFATPDKTLVTPPEKCTPFEKMGQVAEHVQPK